jgi:MerR family redox-sensitive transcriptional activator SoxR
VSAGFDDPLPDDRGSGDRVADDRISDAAEEELTIGEAASRIGIATSALRFYERHGLITSRRTEGGQRRYARDVLRRVAFIRAAQSVGLKLAEIRESLDELPADRAPTMAEWEAFAAQWRPRLDRQIAVLEAIRDKLSACIGCGCQTLDACEVFNPGDKAADAGPGAHYLLPSE